MARFVAEHPDHADRLEINLQRRRALLIETVLDTLAEIPFLRSSVGGVAAPHRLYVRNAVTLACLGEGGPFVIGPRLELYRTLRCKALPRAGDIVAHLRRLAQDSCPLDRRDTVYPSLVEALRSEGASLTMYRTASIVSTEWGYRTPDELLVGSRIPRCLLVAVPHVRGPQPLVAALLSLGAHDEPMNHHWRALFAWFGERYRNTRDPVTKDERAVLRDAYRRCGRTGLPDGLGDDVRCLLGHDGKLYARKDVAAAHFVINDDPVLADAITEQGARLAFADIAETSHEFFRQLNMQRLTSVVGAPEPRIGEERTAPSWVRPAGVVEKLHSEDFASALAAVLRAHVRPDAAISTTSAASVARRLRKIAQIAVVEDVDLIYRVRGTPVVVRKEVWLGDEHISLVWPQSRRDLDQLIAQALAQAVTPVTASQQALADPIYCLITCRTSAEISTYLKRRGIPWQPPSNDMTDADPASEELDGSGVSKVSDASALVTNLARHVMERAGRQPTTDPSLTEPGAGDQQRAAFSDSQQPTLLPLPPFEAVTLKPLIVSDARTPQEARQTGGAGGHGGWSPRTQSMVDRDEEVGLRGEALVYRAEQARVRAFGLDETRVVWTAKHDRAADHDIRSVDEDGADLWIEVKATTSRDGHFQWSVAEFEKAVREGKRYELWRVYEADTTTPSYKRFRDPVSLVQAKKVKMDIATFWAEVEPANI